MKELLVEFGTEDGKWELSKMEIILLFLVSC
jgi:hypothetical protein